MERIFLLIFSFLYVSANPCANLNAKEEKYEDVLVLSKENLVKIMNDLGIQHVDIVLAQAILESGTFTSSIFKTKNNMFGMKVPRKRKTFATNKEGYTGYATYASWIDCVKDYKLYQDFITKKKVISRSEYLAILSRSYSETNGYVNKLVKITNQNKKYT